MDQLQLFYEDKAMRESVHGFLDTVLKQHALDDLVKGKDAGHLGLALKAVDKAFNELRDRYEPKPKPRIRSSR